MPKLSIIIPVYMVEKYVKKCIESVLSQTIKDIEIIIVDDGSKDSSISIIEKCIGQDSRVKIIHKENGGLMSAWIEGVKIASSDYIGFVDSDDWVDPDYFEKLYDVIIKENADIVVGEYVRETGTETLRTIRERKCIYEGHEKIEELIKKYFLQILFNDNTISYCRWDKVYRKDLLKNNLCWLDTRISLGEDVNTNAATLPDCRKVVVLNETPKYHYRFNPKSIFNSFNPLQIENIIYLHDALQRIALAKALDLKMIDVFIGNMVFEEVNKILVLNEKRSYRRNLLRAIIDNKAIWNTYRLYSKERGFFHLVFCKMVEIGFISVPKIIRKTMTASV